MGSTRKTSRTTKAKSHRQRLSTARQLAATLCLGTLVGMIALSAASCETVRGTLGMNDAASPATLKAEPEIRVRVKKAAASTVIDGPSRVALRELGGTTVVLAATPVTFTSSTQGVIASSGDGKQTRFIPGRDVEVVPRDMSESERSATTVYRPGDSVVVDGTSYAGYLRVAPRWSEGAGTFDIISIKPIETYLPGVLSKELYTNWPLQAYEAQAVAARSYALHERDRARTAGKPFDVEASELDQAYGGGVGLNVAIEATRTTRGLVLTNPGGEGGPLLRAYFSSCCGGHPASAADVWPTGNGFEFNRARPLQATQREWYCTSAPRYRWEVTRTDEDLSKRLRAWGKDAGKKVKTITRLRGVEVATRGAGNRPATYTLTDVSGNTYELSAEELRVACNFPYEGSPAITKDNRVFSGDLEMQFFGSQVRVYGKGFGHGVGMCQYCAKGMAERGMDYSTMLKLFYPGAGVKKLY
ncbi:MAG: SpoIID/LytB domain-containing protein [Planctomycetota bacterium]|nr:SpoIID/LytB domain-containing protein [Planctomycetota bacterium]